jgi:hypothetical protein
MKRFEPQPLTAFIPDAKFETPNGDTLIVVSNQIRKGKLGPLGEVYFDRVRDNQTQRMVVGIDTLRSSGFMLSVID